MLKTLSKVLGAAVACAVVIDDANGIAFPAQCWPYCAEMIAAFNAECVNWFGQGWYYCGYTQGWVYCCNANY